MPYILNHMPFRSSSARGDWRKFKKRLKWVLQTTGDGTQKWWVEALTDLGLPISQSTISHWMSEDSKYCPDALYLFGIKKLRTDISIDWLLGFQPAETIDEKFVESKI